MPAGRNDYIHYEIWVTITYPIRKLQCAMYYAQNIQFTNFNVQWVMPRTHQNDGQYINPIMDKQVDPL